MMPLNAFACKKFFALPFSLSLFLILSAVCPPAALAASGDSACTPLFRATGARPSTEPTPNFNCRVTANTASVGLGTYYCTGNGGYVERYCGKAVEDLGCPKNGANGNDKRLVGNPCDAATGNKLQAETDFVAGEGSPLALRRVYNSSSAALTSIAWGIGWRGNTANRLSTYGSSTVLVSRPDGSGLYFSLVSGAWKPRADTTKKLVKTATGWTLTTDDQSVETYDTSGALLSISDRNDRVQQFVHSDGTTGADGGYVLDAAGNPTSTTLPAGLLIRVTDDAGRSLGFGYNSNTRTVKATDPAGGIYLYTYDANNNLTSVTYPDAKKRTYVYGETANTSGVSQPNALTGIIDEANVRYATFQYNADGLAISTEHAGGAQKVTLAYTTDSNGLVTAAATTDARNTQRQLAFTKVAGGIRTQSVTQPTGAGSSASSSTMTYDANGNLASRTDYNGNVTRYSYDLTRNLETARTEAYGTGAARTITTVWHATFRLPTRITEPNRRTDFTYDTKGNLLSKTLTDTAQSITRTWTYSYNTLGQVLTADGPRTDVADITQYTYHTTTSAGNYTRGDLATITNALGHATTITKYDANGRPLLLKDPNGTLTTLTWSPRGWLTSRKVAAQKTAYLYDSVGQLLRVTQQDGSYLAYTYDKAHRLIGITDRGGNKVRYTLDLMGNRTREDTKDPSGVLRQTRTRVFNALNRLQQDIGGTTPSAQITRYGYDNNGNVKTITDPLNHTAMQNYDALDRLVQVTDPANGLITTAYDALDQITQIKDPRAVTTNYTLNALGDLTQTQSPDSGTANTVFDAAGNLTRRTDARGVVANYTYDALNRLTTITYPASPAENVAFTYDSTTNGNKGIGRLTGYGNDGGAAVLVYDAYGNVLTQTELLSSQIDVTAYQYDSANRIKQITYPSGRIVFYTRNILGQITQMQTQDDATATPVIVVSGVAYQPFGPLKNLTHGNGVITTLTHNADYRPSRITATTSPAWDTQYQYDAASHITQQIDTVGSYDKTFGYDTLDRLIADTSNVGSWAYQYDPASNRTQRTGSPQTLTYATASNRLTKNGSTIQTLDASGNLTANGPKAYSYNNANRLSTYKLSGATKAQFRYNAKGLRTQKLQITKPVNYHYNLNLQLLDAVALNADNTFYRRTEYLYLDDRPVVQVITHYGANNAIATRRITYIHADHLNTPRAMSDATKKIVWRWDGDAFGQTAPNQNPDGDAATDTLDLRFAGQIVDQESGLYYNIHRYYDPSIGRYITSDPIGLDGGLNTYGYVNGNPVKFTDPLGLICTTNEYGVQGCSSAGELGFSQNWSNQGNNSFYPRTANNARFNACYETCSKKFEPSNLTENICTISGDTTALLSKSALAGGIVNQACLHEAQAGYCHVTCAEEEKKQCP